MFHKFVEHKLNSGAAAFILILLATPLVSCVSPPTSTYPPPSQLDAKVWLLPVCPSATVEMHGAVPFLAPLVAPLFKGALGSFESLMADLRKADTEGQFTPGETANFLWWYYPAAKSAGPVACVAVMISQSSPADWCNDADSPFSRRAPGVCAYFAKRRSSSEQGMVESSSSQKPVAMPRFYAEIHLQPARDGKTLEPTAVLYYYPDGIHSKFRNKGRKRTVMVTVTAKKTSGDSEVLSPVVGLLKDIQPSQEVEATDLSASKWSLVVLANQDATPTDLAPDAEPVGMTPVNATVEVREVGDPRLLVTFFADLSAILKDPATAEIGAAGKTNPTKK